MTNREKFKETFGFEPCHDICLMPEEIRCPDGDCDQCRYDDWWEKEFTGELEIL